MAISGSQRPAYPPSPLEGNLPSGRLANASSGSNPNVVALDAGTPESTGKPREQPFLPERLFGQESVELVDMHITDHECRLKHVGLFLRESSGGAILPDIDHSYNNNKSGY